MYLDECDNHKSMARTSCNKEPNCNVSNINCSLGLDLFLLYVFFYNLTNTIISTSVPYPHSIIITPRMRRLENTCQFIRNAVTIHRQQLHNWLVCLLADELDNSGAASEMEDTRQRHLSKWQSRLGGWVGWNNESGWH